MFGRQPTFIYGIYKKLLFSNQETNENTFFFFTINLKQKFHIDFHQQCKIYNILNMVKIKSVILSVFPWPKNESFHILSVHQPKPISKTFA